MTVDREEYYPPHRVRDNHFAYDVLMNDRVIDRETRANVGLMLGKMSCFMDLIIHRMRWLMEVNQHV
ncbi:MAG: hypothetical protein WCF90_10520 [Methanomicrobiales archaeon]